MGRCESCPLLPSYNSSQNKETEYKLLQELLEESRIVHLVFELF
jgi:hypothetical protein